MVPDPPAIRPRVPTLAAGLVGGVGAYLVGVALVALLRGAGQLYTNAHGVGLALPPELFGLARGETLNYLARPWTRTTVPTAASYALPVLVLGIAGYAVVWVRSGPGPGSSPRAGGRSGGAAGPDWRSGATAGATVVLGHLPLAAAGIVLLDTHGIHPEPGATVAEWTADPSTRSTTPDGHAERGSRSGTGDGVPDGPIRTAVRSTSSRRIRCVVDAVERSAIVGVPPPLEHCPRDE